VRLRCRWLGHKFRAAFYYYTGNYVLASLCARCGVKHEEEFADLRDLQVRIVQEVRRGWW